jgi:hypothetical protein
VRLEFIGKTKSDLEDLDVQSLKMGQTEVKPALVIMFKTKTANTVLNALNKRLRAVYYEKNGNAAKTQGQLEGVDPIVADLPQLTELGEKLGAIAWPDEQTGCTLVLYHGIRDAGAFKLKDGIVRKVKMVCHDGGTVDTFWHFYTTDVDAETIGEIAVLKSHEVELELTAPEIISGKQKDLVDGAKPPKTPESALAGTEPAANADTSKKAA